MRDLPRASHQAQAMLQFGKQAEKLRRALGPVREFDVWIGKLRDLRSSLIHSGDYVPRSARQECLRGIERLEDRCKRKRRSAEKKLVARSRSMARVSSRRRKRLRSSLSDLCSSARSQGLPGSLLRGFDTVRAEFPTLDEANLHEFRKRIKMVRYLAEMHAALPILRVGQIATQIKKLQAAIGEWHDWQALAARRRTADTMPRAKPWPNCWRPSQGRSFETALSTVNSVTAHMPGARARRPPSLRIRATASCRRGVSAD